MRCWLQYSCAGWWCSGFQLCSLPSIPADCWGVTACLGIPLRGRLVLPPGYSIRDTWGALSKTFSWKPSFTIFRQAYSLTQIWFSCLHVPTNRKKPRSNHTLMLLGFVTPQKNPWAELLVKVLMNFLKGLMENPIFLLIHFFLIFTTLHKRREIKQAVSACYFLPLREVSSPLDQLLLFFHFPPSTGEMGCFMCSTDGDSAYGSRQRELRGGVKREDVLPLTPQWELLFGMTSFSALMDWQQCMVQSLSLIFLA